MSRVLINKLFHGATVVALAAVVAITGCVSIPWQPEVVSQTDNGAISVTTAGCADDGRYSVQPVRHVSSRHSPANIALDPAGFSILSWNIYKGSRQNWKQDVERIGYHQDILLFQEALLNDELKDYLQQRHLSWQLNNAFSLNNRQTGVMTAARVQSAGHCALRTAEPMIRTPKTILISRYDLAGMPQQLLVANIHSINFSLGLGAYGKQLQALEEILGRHQGPIVLAGDFNNWSDGRSRLISEMVQRLSLEQLPYRNHNRTRVMGSAIDHIFYRGLVVVDHKTHEVTSSDHNPITVTFRTSPAKLRVARKI